MKRSTLAARAAVLAVCLSATMPALAAQPAAGQDRRATPGGECVLPDGTRATLAAQGPMSRAAVRADVEVWRASGMAQLSRARPLPDVYSERYRRYYAAYLRMRGGPEFAAALCRELRDAD